MWEISKSMKSVIPVSARDDISVLCSPTNIPEITIKS